MVPFFRQIRKQLADDNQFLKYSRYAIAEIEKLTNKRQNRTQEMRKLTVLLIGLMILALTEPANSQKKAIDGPELEVLREIVLADSIPTVYFKTTVSELHQPLSRHLFYLRGFDVCSSLVDLDSVKLDKEEQDYIVDRFASMEVANINKLVRDPKNHTLKQLEGHEWSVISLPVVFRDGQYAIYYSKGEYSGQFILMKNIDGSWKNVCYSAVWSE